MIDKPGFITVVDLTMGPFYRSVPLEVFSHNVKAKKNIRQSSF